MLNKRLVSLFVLFLVLLWLGSPSTAFSTQPNLPDAPLGSGFTYHGLLKNAGGVPINSTCDLRFSLWNDANLGTQIGIDCTVTGVSVVQGHFTGLVNAGGEFGSQPMDNANARWLSVKTVA